MEQTRLPGLPGQRAEARPRAPRATANRLPQRRDPRKIFVAYPYGIPKDDYRRPFTELSKAFDVRFEFADEQITNVHILEKITSMILTSRFSLFDITRWNPNVTLELGIAIGQRRDYYLLFNPADHQPDAPADLGGIDRIQYKTYTELGTGLTQLLIQQFGVPQEGDKNADPMEGLRRRVLAIVDAKNGPKMRPIATELGVPIELTKAVVRAMVEDGVLRTTGQTYGTRYYRANA